MVHRRDAEAAEDFKKKFFLCELCAFAVNIVL